MKHTSLLALGLALAACSHNEPATDPSAVSVDQASSTPSENPDFTPPENRVDDAPSTIGTSGTEPSGTTAGSTTTATTTTSSEKTATPPTTGTTTMAPASGTTTPVADTTKPVKPDNTAVNKRDRDASALTPMDQSESPSDLKITQEIRQAVMKDGSLSFSAKNVKIITIAGKVTLRGPVKNAAERTAIESAATKVAGAGRVDSHLEVTN